MVLRTARRGKNPGEQFWGCSNYLSHKGIVTEDKKEDHPIGPITKNIPSTQFERLTVEPVHWRDSLPRGSYYSEYIAIGAVPGFALEQRELQNHNVQRITSQALLLSKRSELKDVPVVQKTLACIIQKLLTRGTLPLSTLGVEEALSYLDGISENVKEIDKKNIEVGWKWTSKSFMGLAQEITKASSYRSPVSENDLLLLTNDVLSDVLDGENERYFFSTWLTQKLGRSVLHWIVPQAELDLILASAGLKQSGQRKIDFLFCHPVGGAIAIELDGEDHAVKAKSDEERNIQLAEAGITTFRISNKELEKGEGINLNQLESALRYATTPTMDKFSSNGIPFAITAASMAARFQFILARALSSGQLKLEAKEWNINVRSDYIGMNIIQAAANDFADMLDALSVLYLGNKNLININCITDKKTHLSSDFSVVIFAAESPMTLSLRMSNEDYVLCPAFAPVEFATNAQKINSRSHLMCKDDELIENSLRFFLQNLFRKRAFRELQAEAIRKAIGGVDTVTLLPTGAGKSIIYQLAGLLQSGITLVIDPIIALIEDQILGLARVGINKAGAPPSGLYRAEERRKWLRAVERGDFQFILLSPERLQMAETRETLRSLVEVTFVNLAVIDEAHCVSEWGHNFRFSYLNLADNLRTFCRALDGQSPTLLALTGTASRSVLRELLTELKIDKNNSEALIRPLNFDRSELKFHITKVNTGGDNSSVLRGILNGLPAKFNAPPGEFFQPAGSSTNSGIVFTPFVNGRTHGVDAVKSAIQSAVNVAVTTYSGSAPKTRSSSEWEIEKRSNAQSFKDNKTPILVATKAFGMGIDKPNIRWTIHMGVPSSIEAFYQEAGRAGRDKGLAYCSLIFSEVDIEATDKMLAGQGTLEELRMLAASLKGSVDDISRALFFHLNAYSGVDEELEEVSRVLGFVGDLMARRNVVVPFNNSSRASLERAVLRLIKSGIVDDLEVNYGSGHFLLNTPIFDFDRARKKIEQYINESQPARLKIIVQELDQIGALKIHAQPIQLCQLMINFTYDVIERSRRRMLYEAILLGRNYSNDSEIRKYLLDYLQEGLGAEQIAELAEQQEIDFDKWIELFEKVSTPLDAGEIRGIIIRVLENFPDHPGLLVARGISEALVAKPDYTLVNNSLLTALDSGKNRYLCNNEQILALVNLIINLANIKSTNLRLPIVNAVYKSQAFNSADRQTLLNSIKSSSVAWDRESKMCLTAIIANSLVNNAINSANSVVQHFSDIQRKLT
jgi:ATP-dependent DNA helicase RecQ